LVNLGIAELGLWPTEGISHNFEEKNGGVRMALKKVISAEDAVAIVQDDDVLATSGYGCNGIPTT